MEIKEEDLSHQLTRLSLKEQDIYTKNRSTILYCSFSLRVVIKACNAERLAVLLLGGRVELRGEVSGAHCALDWFLLHYNLLILLIFVATIMSILFSILLIILIFCWLGIGIIRRFLRKNCRRGASFTRADGRRSPHLHHFPRAHHIQIAAQLRVFDGTPRFR